MAVAVDISPSRHKGSSRKICGMRLVSGRHAASGRNIGLKVTIEQIDKGFAGEGLAHRRGSAVAKPGLQRNKPRFHDRHETSNKALFWYDSVALLGYWDTLDVVPGTATEAAFGEVREGQKPSFTTVTYGLYRSLSFGLIRVHPVVVVGIIVGILKAKSQYHHASLRYARPHCET